MQERHTARAPRQRGAVVPFNPLAGVLAVLAVAGIAILILWQTNVIFSSSAPTPIPGIHLTYPKTTWVQVPPATVSGAPANAVAALARKRGSAVIIVARQTATPISMANAHTIVASLKAKFADFKPLRARVVPLANGPGLLISYERTKQGPKGELHTLTLVPAGPIDYVLESASPVGNARIDGELQAIVTSARLIPKK